MEKLQPTPPDNHTGRSSEAEINQADEDKLMLSVVCPCYNESEVLGLFYSELKSVLDSLSDYAHEIIFVDDGSTDETSVLLDQLAEQDRTVRVRILSRNFGHQLALTAGLDIAKGDAVIMMDSDLQHPPALIPEMIQKWREGFDVISAVRSSSAGTSKMKDLSSKAFYQIVNMLSSTHITPNAADFCLLSRYVLSVLAGMRERHRFLRGMISWIGFRRAFIPYEASIRAAGRSKYTFFKMTALAMDAVFSFSATPLKLATRFGLIITFSGFIYLSWILGRFFFLDDLVAGWGSLICVTLILGGSQLVFIGLIGQYIARVFDEVKGRPMYIVKEKPGDSQHRKKIHTQTDSHSNGSNL